MNNVYLKYILMTISLMFFLVGCDSGSNEAKRALPVQEDEQSFLTLYMTNQSRNELLPYEVNITDMDISERILKIIDYLKNGVEDNNYFTTIPSDLVVESIVVDGDNVILYIEDVVSKMSSVDFIIFRSSLIKSLTAIDGIESIEFYVDGVPMKDSSGKIYGTFDGDDVVIASMNIASSTSTKTLVLYYPDNSGTSLIRVYREVSVLSTESLESRIIEELRKIPEGFGLAQVMPEESVLKSIEVSEGVCYIDFDENFKSKNYSGSTGEEMTVYAIVNSLTELPTISHVQFLLEGEKVETLKGHLNFASLFESNVTLVNKEVEYID